MAHENAESTDPVSQFVARVKANHDELTEPNVGQLDPRIHQGWWVMLDGAARRSDFEQLVLSHSPAVIGAVSRDSGPLSDPGLRMVAFYLLWQVFRRNGCANEQYALLGALTPTDSSRPHPLADYGGEALLRAFRALLVAGELDASRAMLSEAFLQANEIIRLYPRVLAFTRLRRSVGIALIERLTGDGADADLRSSALRAVRDDFLAERHADSQWLTPQLKAETLSAEARMLCLPGAADYGHAIRLVLEAKQTDRKADGESEAAFRARVVSYDQQTLLIRSLQNVQDIAIMLERRLEEKTAAVEAKMERSFEHARRESVQTLGLLAAVIALITAAAGSRTGQSLGGVLTATVATAGMVVVSFAAFVTVFSGRRPWHRWAVAGLGVGLLALGFLLFALAPLKAQFG